MIVENMVNMQTADLSGMKVQTSKTPGETSSFEKLLNQQNEQKKPQNLREQEMGAANVLMMMLSPDTISQELNPPSDMTEQEVAAISSVTNMTLPELSAEQESLTTMSENMVSLSKPLELDLQQPKSEEISSETNSVLSRSEQDGISIPAQIASNSQESQMQQNSEKFEKVAVKASTESDKSVVSITTHAAEKEEPMSVQLKELTEILEKESGAETEETIKKQEVKMDNTQSLQSTFTQQPIQTSGNAFHLTQTEEPVSSSEISPKYMELIKENITKQIASGRQELQIQLNPANLGKMVVKASYEAGKTMISIVCSTDKTMQAMAVQAKELAAMLENRTGQTTEVIIDQTATDYLQQEQQGQGQNSQNQDAQNQHQGNNQNEFYDSQNFLEQLRLGLA